MTTPFPVAVGDTVGGHKQDGPATSYQSMTDAELHDKPSLLLSVMQWEVTNRTGLQQAIN